MAPLLCPRRTHLRLVILLVFLVFLFYILVLTHRTVYTALTLFTLPFTWGLHSDRFVISQENDDFDVTFSNYSRTQTISGDGFPDRVPPILHHVLLGHPGANLARDGGQWSAARQSCLDLHPGWETHLWTDEKASAFVTEKFPELKEMWDNYPFLIQRVDALRHMLLYEYGGVVLDFDLKCRRSLGPLRRFGFVAPEAHPVGVSVGFIMAERHNPLVGSIVQNLRAYNHRWLGLPYATIMFSTGCHFVSTIHSLQGNRTDYKVLRGPPENPKLHQVNGAVSTPLFEHLGSSAWHTTLDCRIIVMIGRYLKLVLAVLFLSSVGLVLYSSQRWRTVGARMGTRKLSQEKNRVYELDLESCSSTVSWPSPKRSN